jgi:DNA-binding IclR family transcriptional regulator
MAAAQQRHNQPPIQSLDRGIRLLEVIAASAQPLSGVEVADRAGINRSTAWRLLGTLEQGRLVERDETGRYQVGVGLFGLATSSRWGSIARRARPILERLCNQVDSTVAVAVVDGGGYEIIDQVDGNYSLSVRWVGTRLPLSCTSVGKLILAAMDEHELELFLRHPIAPRTPLTLTDPADVRAELEEVRKTGVGISNGDYETGVNGISAAAHDVHGRPVAFIAITGPDVRLTTASLPDVAPVVLEAAAELEAALELKSETIEPREGQ